MKETAVAAPEEHGWVVVWDCPTYGACVMMFCEKWNNSKDAERIAAQHSGKLFTKEEFLERLGV